MKLILCLTISLVASTCGAWPWAWPDDVPLFHSIDPLAQRDEYGRLHQSPWLVRPDFELRYSRSVYYWQSGESLCRIPAYVGSMQTALRRLGYYCGPIDGIFTAEVSGAIARMQKNYSMTVTGTLTVPVRRALFLP